MRSFLQRDLAELATYGIDAPVIAALQTLRTTMSGTTSDAVHVGILKSKVVLQAQARTALVVALNGLRGRAYASTTLTEGLASSLGIDAISDLNDSDLARAAEVAVGRATALLPDLVGTGIDAPLLATITPLINTLDLAINATDDARSARDLAARDRINKGNALYAEIVRLAGLGKTAYYSTNEAKYNDYVLTESSQAGGTSRSGSLAATAVTNVSFMAIESDDSFTIKNTSAHPMEVYFDESEGGQPEPDTLITAVPANSELQRTAAQLGQSELKAFLTVRNPGPGGPVTWQVVRQD